MRERVTIRMDLAMPRTVAKGKANFTRDSPPIGGTGVRKGWKT